jgi:hypothetical protein
MSAKSASPTSTSPPTEDPTNHVSSSVDTPISTNNEGEASVSRGSEAADEPAEGVRNEGDLPHPSTSMLSSNSDLGELLMAHEKIGDWNELVAQVLLSCQYDSVLD